MIVELISAAVGTMAFSLLFGVPKKFYLHCGGIGAAGWFVYKVMLEKVGLSIAVSVFMATLVIVLLSRYAAVFEKCPATVFLITGIFPVVPGAQIYWATYYLVTDQLINRSQTDISVYPNGTLEGFLRHLEKEGK